MEIMLDIVLNHVSTKNEMFKKAISGDKDYEGWGKSKKVTDEINDFGSLINKIFESTSDKFISHLHNYWKRIGVITTVSLYVRPGNVL